MRALSIASKFIFRLSYAWPVDVFTPNLQRMSGCSAGLRIIIVITTTIFIVLSSMALTMCEAQGDE